MTKIRNFNTPILNNLPGAGTEQSYPGQKLGMSLQETKHFVQNQIKSIGLKTALVVGTVTDKIQLPGDAAIFVGIGFDKLVDADFTLTVNQGIIHESIGTAFATVGNAGGLGIQPYFPVNMPVSGNDTIKIDFVSNFAGNLRTLIYYK
jgi:hypothetical protein